ncbi:hypothetical protein K432DRAFT_439681 [Lepidopterella palustris CBS 459.81]|uniref:HORMA domain-containing protein n=1 Tax=Lepidopterella palustris CBS 459.81 TaxID=1314670 RepID=A0A8E2EJ61_9PEZI|nr:hypothetical protein K432DRAFT_439681 [Lepidopterella palustris CBS 459.81]
MARTQVTKTRPRGMMAATVTTQMPSVKSAQRTEESTTTSAQLIEQQQSTEVVQTLLHGSISCLSYLRALFAESCFDNQHYETNEVHWSYDDYAIGKTQPRHASGQSVGDRKGKTESKRQGTMMKVLRRGRSKAVDQLLDWLEKGAFEALRRGVLRAIQLNIFEDASNPSNVIEMYTFTLKYIQSADNKAIFSGIEMTGPRAESITVKNAKHAMQMFIRRMIALCGTLPDLPQRRYLNIHLFYNDDCDPEYEPPGFDKSTDNTVFFPETEWKKATSDCGEMDAGFHAVVLKVSYLHLAMREKDHNAGSEMGFEIPNGLLYTAEASREDDIDFHMADTPPELEEKNVMESVPLVRSPQCPGFGSEGATVALQSARETSSCLQTISNAQGPQVMFQEIEPPVRSLEINNALEKSACEERVLDTPERQGMDLDESCPLAETHGPGGCSHQFQEDSASPPAAQLVGMPSPIVDDAESQSTTKPPEDLQMKKQLQNMLEPSALGKTTEDTQQISQPFGQIDRHHDNIDQMSALRLSQMKLEELDAKRNQILPPRRLSPSRRRRSTSIDLTGERDFVVCQCGWNEEEDDMINCSFCDTWQHLHCYGYRGSDDPRIAKVHACYQCLLQDKEMPLLRELKDLALLRRGVHIIRAQGYSNDREFSSALHCDLQTASRLATHLRKQGYLVATPGSKKRDFASTGQPKFLAVTTEPALSRMMKECFDPMTKVAHHFELSPSNEVLAETNITTQLPLPPDGSIAVLNSMEIDQAPFVDPDETQDEQSVAPPTTTISSSLRARSTRVAGLPANRLVSHTTAGLAESSQATRYPLRHRNPNIGPSKDDGVGASGVYPFGPVTPAKKRGREDKDVPGTTTPGSKRKKTKSSKTSGLINIGESMSPSPGLTPARSKRG